MTVLVIVGFLLIFMGLVFIVLAIVYDEKTKAAFKQFDADAIAVLEAVLESDEKYAKEKIKYVLQLVKGKL